MPRIVGFLLVLAATGAVWGFPIAVDQTLANRTFEWKAEYSSRSAGSYGQYTVTLTANSSYEIFTSSLTAGG